MIFVIGGVGFIGSFVLEWLTQSNEPVVNLTRSLEMSDPAPIEATRYEPNSLYSATGTPVTI